MNRLSPSGVLACLLLLLPSAFLSLHLQRAVSGIEARSIDLSKLPADLGEWHGADSEGLDLRSQDILKLDEFLRRRYSNPDGRSVFVYVGYWKHQSGEHQAAKHSPLMCFPANGITISTPEERMLSSKFAVSRLLAERQSRTSLYYYWFFSGNETYRDETFALFHVVRETILHGRSDGGIVEISAAVDQPGGSPQNQQHAERTLEDFAVVFVPELEKIIGDRQGAGNGHRAN